MMAQFSTANPPSWKQKRISSPIKFKKNGVRNSLFITESFKMAVLRNHQFILKGTCRELDIDIEYQKMDIFLVNKLIFCLI